MATHTTSRRKFLKMAVGGAPIVVGGALITRGGILVADLWWREQHVGELAANTGRARAIHQLDGAATATPFAPEPGATDHVTAILPSPDDPVVSGETGGKAIVGRLKIPALNLDAPMVRLSVVYKPDGQPYWQTADHAVGWHDGTAPPGSAIGNTVISGHISSQRQGDVFRHLPEINLGDESRITLSGSTTTTYRVVDKLVVDPADTWVMDPTKAPIATFICCVPDGVYSQRLVVVSEPVRG
ncbi:MAG: sortase [Dehalococcoidia bacterium]|nr:sortase [Dehalococcoidia bacterium]